MTFVGEESRLHFSTIRKNIFLWVEECYGLITSTDLASGMPVIQELLIPQTCAAIAPVRIASMVWRIPSG